VHHDPRRRVRRLGAQPAGALVPDRRRRHRHEVPDRDRDLRSARNRCRSLRSTTIRTPRPTPTWPRACRTCSPPRASRTT
jgi:hypothetical protein